MAEPNTHFVPEPRVAHTAVGVMQPPGPPSLGEALQEQDDHASPSVPTPEVDRVQEEVMAATSPDGRPPHRATRIAEWKWFIVGAGIAWAAQTVLGWSSVVTIVALVIFSFAASSPVWGAGLLRRGEERRARKVALVHTHRNGTST
jgi:hypothetical protein